MIHVYVHRKIEEKGYTRVDVSYVRVDEPYTRIGVPYMRVEELYTRVATTYMRMDGTERD